MPFNKVLIANRGEIAVRILKTLRRLGIPGVVAYHAVDRDSLAVELADEAVRIDGDSPVAAYLDQHGIVAACRRVGADAVHPGFGFLAENAAFARRLEQEGICFVGPHAEVIELMGNKTRAREFCVANGYPIAASVNEEPGATEEFLDRARALGAPLLIKAAAGGGGKGLHIVRDLRELDTACALARGEALRAFGSAEIYAERYIEQPRHLEVQVLADHHGSVLHLWERECSIQRRFQKVIEEAPSPTIDEHTRQRLCDTAVSIARSARYRNAGTVEFIADRDGRFHFLEMNTRIQVEHPVTEAITGLDIVEQQLRISAGEPLAFAQHEVRREGHAIEARLYAEDPDRDFAPATGPLLLLRMPAGVRVDAGFREGQTVGAAFDPMLAKLIAHGASRGEAIAQLSTALEATRALGVDTNLDLLRAIAGHPDFAAARLHTGFLVEQAAALRGPQPGVTEREVLLAAAVLGSRQFTDPAFAAPEPHARIGGWRN